MTVTATDPAGPEKRGKGRAGAIAGRLRLRRRQEVTREDGQFHFSPEYARRHGEAVDRADGRLRSQLLDGLSVLDDIAGQPEREFPYPGSASPDQAVAVMLAGSDAEEYLLAPRPAPSFTPAAELRRTAPVPALREPADYGRSMLRRLESGLRGLDWADLDEAQRQGVTYAQAHASRGRTPLGDKAERNSRAKVRPVRRHGEAVRRRVGELRYPKPDVTVPVSVTAAAYDAVMRHADAITGTRGIGPGRAPLPAITAGGAL